MDLKGLPVANLGVTSIHGLSHVIQIESPNREEAAPSNPQKKKEAFKR